MHWYYSISIGSRGSMHWHSLVAEVALAALVALVAEVACTGIA